MTLSTNVFKVNNVLRGDTPDGDDQCQFDHERLERALKELVNRKLQEENVIMADNDERLCPTFVVATKGLHAEGPPTVFRSYQCEGYSPSKCAIWQAARATTAAPSLFKPIKIETPKPGATFVDGGIGGHNNPSELALLEAQRIWRRVKRFTLVSIGTGRQKSVPVVDVVKLEKTPSRFVSRLLFWNPDIERIPQGMVAFQKLADACVQLIINSEPVHQRLFGFAYSVRKMGSAKAVS